VVLPGYSNCETALADEMPEMPDAEEAEGGCAFQSDCDQETLQAIPILNFSI
jgi:hypothetical protein